MSKVRRGGIVACGLMLSITLAACSGGSTGQTGSPEETTSGSATSSASQSGIEISNPKDAAALDPCELLPDETANTLGMKTEGEISSNDLKSNLPDICKWKGVNSYTTISLTAFSERSIQQYYDNKSDYKYFKKLDISGNPAVVANVQDPAKNSDCAIYMAASENQVVMSSTFISSGDTKRADPCKLAKRALKLSSSSWPAAK